MTERLPLHGVAASLSRSEGIGVILILLIAAGLYRPVRRSGFVYDDRWYVASNEGIRRFDPFSIFAHPDRAAASESGLSTDAYRPIVTLSYALDYQLWKLEPLWFHLENLFLHLLNGFLAWILLRRLLDSVAGRLAALCLFLWHPVQVQSVAWISQRSTLLSSAGMLIALLALGAPGPWTKLRVMAGWAAYAVAICCRETTGGLILALGCWDFCAPSPDRRGVWRRYAGLLAITLAFVVFRSHLLPKWSEFEGPRHWRADAALGVMAFALYLGKLFWPTHLRLHYQYPLPNSGRLLLAALVVLLYVSIVLWSARRDRRKAAALAWVAIFLIPVLQVIPIAAFAAERYLYFSLIGFVWWVGLFYEQYPFLRGIVWSAVFIFGMATARLVPHWQSDETIWSYSVSNDPGDAFALGVYGSVVKDPTRSEALFRQVLHNNPPQDLAAAAYTNLSWFALQRGEYREAEHLAKQALSLVPGRPEALQNLQHAQAGLRRRT